MSDTPIRLAILKENTLLLCRSQRQAIAIALFIAIAFSALLYISFLNCYPFYFLAVLVLAILARWSLVSRYQFVDKQSAKSIRVWRHQFSIVNGFYGFLWGMITPQFAFMYEDNLALLVLVVPVFLYVGSIAYLCYSKRAILIFALSIVVPLLSNLLIRGENLFNWYALLMLTFFSASYFSAMKLNGLVDESLKFKFENIALSENLQNANIELQKLSDTDPLTGVLNRRAFERSFALDLRKVRRNKRPLTLLIIDIDHFKKINDTWGHVVGDEVIRVVAQSIVVSLLRPGDTLARFGGEEFVVSMPDTGLGGATQVAERIRKHIQSIDFSMVLDENTTQLTVSVGVHCQLIDDATTAEDMLVKADKALYQAKNNGRNQCVLYEEGDNA